MDFVTDNSIYIAKVDATIKDSILLDGFATEPTGEFVVSQFILSAVYSLQRVETFREFRLPMTQTVARSLYSEGYNPGVLTEDLVTLLARSKKYTTYVAFASLSGQMTFNEKSGFEFKSGKFGEGIWSNAVLVQAPYAHLVYELLRQKHHDLHLRMYDKGD
jgi:hypothetical protein